MTRVQKLYWYAGQLLDEAGAAEKSGNNETAITSYLKAADLLLLLAKSESSYTIWKNYADKANFCQNRVKVLIASRPQ